MTIVYLLLGSKSGESFQLLKGRGNRKIADFIWYLKNYGNQTKPNVSIFTILNCSGRPLVGDWYRLRILKVKLDFSMIFCTKSKNVKLCPHDCPHSWWACDRSAGGCSSGGGAGRTVDGGWSGPCGDPVDGRRWPDGRRGQS